MSDPGRGSMRVARGLTLSALCLTLSVSAHVSAGGAVQLSVGFVVTAAALSGMCVAAADRQRTFGGIMTMMGWSQLPLHLLAGASGHHGDHGVVGLGPAMVAWHLGAALVLSVALAHGERLIWALFGLLLPFGLRMAARPLPVRPSRPAPAPDTALTWRGSVFERQNGTLRGPPVHLI